MPSLLAPSSESSRRFESIVGMLADGSAADATVPGPLGTAIRASDWTSESRTRRFAAGDPISCMSGVPWPPATHLSTIRTSSAARPALRSATRTARSATSRSKSDIIIATSCALIARTCAPPTSVDGPIRESRSTSRNATPSPEPSSRVISPGVAPPESSTRSSVRAAMVEQDIAAGLHDGEAIPATVRCSGRRLTRAGTNVETKRATWP